MTISGSGAVWERLNANLPEHVRIQAGRQAQPSAAILDSQTVKTTHRGGAGGYDGDKKISGHKGYLLVDTMGLVLKAFVPQADLCDRDAAPALAEDFWTG